ncbi:MAG: hypothetical protein UT20_C0037G0006 [Candidatus Levybacteria bacterium GW2011_GWA1_39_11]|nr:MAG: hypothetical protein UT20_C0037G0006 [Candidatus Levybacteria bacterium GW2011_GWA1_39_11]
MYKRLPIDEKLTAIKRVLDGERVSRVCRDEGISRTIFYKWLNDYKKTGPRGKRKVLTARVVRGNDHWKSFSTETRRKIIKLALKNPLLSPQKIAQVVDASPSGIWYLLKRNGLNTGEARRQYIYRNGKSLVRERPVSFKLTMMRRFEAGEKVAKICRDFGVSRTIFYRWLKRYEQERSSESLESLRPAGEEHYRFIPEAPELISKIVASDPRLSPQKISTTLNSEASKKLMSPSGVYYVLKRLNLNTYQKRLVFAQSNAPAMSHVPKIVREEKTPIGSIPSISALAPPGFLRGFFSSRPFIIFLSTFIPALLVYILISTLFSTQGLTARIGMIFSFTSLIFGIFFFIYSLKYYLTIALVLSFSRKGEEGPAGRQGEKKRGIGLQADLSNIHLERQPFVSIHIASFNEKRVINRLLTAATSLDYENYEVVIADDSTDETLDFLATWSKHPRVKISHRDTREGFKGGALRLALSVCDPRTEFVIVFDADFIPYPDTITQFLKYFQSTAGTLDFQQGDRVQGLGPRDNNTKPYTLVAKPFPIAAVQGYQWHVLNKSENWVTRGVRSEYSGSYVIERSGEEIYQGLKQISGSVYMIRRDVLESIGWGNSITEDFQLTLKLYEKGYKVVYTPYVQAPADSAGGRNSRR